MGASPIFPKVVWAQRIERVQKACNALRLNSFGISMIV